MDCDSFSNIHEIYVSIERSITYPAGAFAPIHGAILYFPRTARTVSFLIKKSMGTDKSIR